MKAFLQISFFILIASQFCFSQWYQQNSGTNDSLYFVQFVNDQVGWASSPHRIFKTTDGGVNWQLQYITPLQDSIIWKMFFINENVGWFAIWYIEQGYFATELIKTTDGGESWFQVYLGVNEHIYDVEFVNPDTGWIVGYLELLGYIFKSTTDGGTTWTDKTVPPGYSFELDEIEAFDNMNLIILGYQTLFKTTDGGTSWQEIPMSPNPDRFSLQFLNMNLGWTLGFNYSTAILFKTTDGGYTWVQQVQPVSSYNFATEQIGWYTLHNQIYYSVDGGNSWSLQNSNTSNILHDIFFIDNNNGWAVGHEGTILHTNNGGTPVELISFNAEVSENERSVELNWATATETNNSGFEIQRNVSKVRSKESEWEKIGFVPGHGTTTETQQYSFKDNNISIGKYQYRLKQIDFDGSFNYSKIVEVTIESQKKFSLSQNYPNPFNPATSIQYALGNKQFVSLKIYDVLGNEVATLVSEEKPAGEYEVEFAGSGLPSGIYFYQLKVGNYIETKKMVLMK